MVRKPARGAATVRRRFTPALEPVEPRALLAASCVTLGLSTLSLRGLAVARDGRLLAADGAQIVTVSATGPIQRTTAAPDGSWINQIAAGPDGRTWYVYTRNVTAGGTDHSLSFLDERDASGRATSHALGVDTVVSSLTTASDGSAWLLEGGANGGDVLHVAPGGPVRSFPIAGKDDFNGSLALDSQGTPWFTVALRSSSTQGGEQFVLDKLAPDGRVTEIPLGVTRLPSRQGTPARTVANTPGSLATGPDGKVWFVEQRGPGSAIDRVDASGRITRFPLSLKGDISPNWLAAGPGHELSFTLFSGSGVMDGSTRPTLGHITTTGRVTYEDLHAAHPEFIAGGPDGSLWYADPGAGTVARVAPPSRGVAARKR